MKDILIIGVVGLLLALVHPGGELIIVVLFALMVVTALAGTLRAPDIVAICGVGLMWEAIFTDSRNTPPTFLLHAQDDPIDPVENSLVYYSALRKAGVPAEMHVYMKGGHAFGLRPTESPITRWPQLVETWLATVGLTSK